MADQTRYTAAILAGGMATRLRPITDQIPKAMIEVGGEPFIAHQLRLLRFHGFSRIVICAWYHGEMIRDFVGSGASFSLQIQYVFDGKHPLGTAGALRQALPFLDKNFFVIYGDSYLPCNYHQVQVSFELHHKMGLMTVYHNAGNWDKSNVEFDGQHILAYDKKHPTPQMAFIDYGLGVFNYQAFKNIPKGEFFDLAAVYQGLLHSNHLAAYQVRQRFYEIGSFEGLKELDILLSENPNRFLEVIQ